MAFFFIAAAFPVSTCVFIILHLGSMVFISTMSIIVASCMNVTDMPGLAKIDVIVIVAVIAACTCLFVAIVVSHEELKMALEISVA